MSEFVIQTKNGNIVFLDVIALNEDQQIHLSSSCTQCTLQEWRVRETGIKIALTFNQRNLILQYKNNLLCCKNEKAILGEGLIIFTVHSQERMAIRIDNRDKSKPPKPETVLLVVKLVSESQDVDEEAEWKGYHNLAYTLIHQVIRVTFKVTISFETIGNSHIKVITVSNDHIDDLMISLGELPNVKSELARLKKELLNRNILD